MEIIHLQEDEIDVECMVRSTGGKKESSYSQLRSQIILEFKTPNLKPAYPHAAASKNSRREINICAAKLLELQET